MSKKTKTTDAVEILRRRYIGDDTRLQEAFRQELIHAEVARQIYFARKRAGLTQGQLAKRIGSKQSVISRLEHADYEGHSLSMLGRIAQALGQQLEVRLTEPASIGRKADLPDLSDLPSETIRDIRKRNWLSLSGKVMKAREELQWFIGQSRICRYAARQGCSTERKGNPKAIACWLRKLEVEAEDIDAPNFDASQLGKEQLSGLVHLSTASDGPVQSVEWLRAKGVRLVFVESLAKASLDGATILADDGNPVIGHGLRHDRLDNFWFTLFHEIGHVVLHMNHLETAPIVDEEILQEKGLDKSEGEANRFAADVWVNPKEWKKFRSDVGPRISFAQIETFAKHLAVTPALVAGRLRHEMQKHTHYDKLLGRNKVRELLREQVPVY